MADRILEIDAEMRRLRAERATLLDREAQIKWDIRTLDAAYEKLADERQTLQPSVWVIVDGGGWAEPPKNRRGYASKEAAERALSALAAGQCWIVELRMYYRDLGAAPEKRADDGRQPSVWVIVGHRDCADPPKNHQGFTSKEAAERALPWSCEGHFWVEELPMSYD